jgi:hypothetical protein
VVRDDPDNAAALHVEQGSLDRAGTVKMSMRAGGGYIVRLSK